jgi:hypothetical protein
MPHRKPLGWPKLMVAKRLQNGTIAYYWQPPTWAKTQGCPMVGEALGVDFAEAKDRCDKVLNPQFDAWRTGSATPSIERLSQASKNASVLRCRVASGF